MKFDKVLREASLTAAEVAGTDTPSSVDWVNSKGSKAKKGHIGMAFNKNAPGQKPAHKRKKK
jgi:Tfp pilus assembly protein PilZ